MSWFRSRDKKKADVIDVDAKVIDEKTVEEKVNQEDASYEKKYEERKKEREEYRKEQREKDNVDPNRSDVMKAIDTFEREIQRFAKSVKDGAVNGFRSARNVYKTSENSDLTNRLVKILPYMNEEDIHEMVDKISSGDPDFKDLNPVAIMPFLEDEDCDKLFLYEMKKGGTIDIEMVHFVSEDCLSVLVDAYIEGKYPDLDIDALYPFLDSDDVKKLFYFELKNKKEKK